MVVVVVPFLAFFFDCVVSWEYGWVREYVLGPDRLLAMPENGKVSGNSDGNLLEKLTCKSCVVLGYERN